LTISDVKSGKVVIKKKLLIYKKKKNMDFTGLSNHAIAALKTNNNQKNSA